MLGHPWQQGALLPTAWSPLQVLTYFTVTISFKLISTVFFFFNFHVIYCPLGCAASIAVITAEISSNHLSACLWCPVPWNASGPRINKSLLLAIIEHTTVRCDSQSDLEAAMLRAANWLYAELHKNFLCLDKKLRTRESQLNVEVQFRPR